MPPSSSPDREKRRSAYSLLRRKNKGNEDDYSAESAPHNTIEAREREAVKSVSNESNNVTSPARSHSQYTNGEQANFYNDDASYKTPPHSRQTITSNRSLLQVRSSSRSSAAVAAARTTDTYRKTRLARVDCIMLQEREREDRSRILTSEEDIFVDHLIPYYQLLHQKMQTAVNTSQRVSRSQSIGFNVRMSGQSSSLLWGRYPALVSSAPSLVSSPQPANSLNRAREGREQRRERYHAAVLCGGDSACASSLSSVLASESFHVEDKGNHKVMSTPKSQQLTNATKLDTPNVSSSVCKGSGVLSAANTRSSAQQSLIVDASPEPRKPASVLFSHAKEVFVRSTERMWKEVYHPAEEEDEWRQTTPNNQTTPSCQSKAVQTAEVAGVGEGANAAMLGQQSYQETSEAKQNNNEAFSCHNTSEKSNSSDLSSSFHSFRTCPSLQSFQTETDQHNNEALSPLRSRPLSFDTAEECIVEESEQSSNGHAEAAREASSIATVEDNTIDEDYESSSSGGSDAIREQREAASLHLSTLQSYAVAPAEVLNTARPSAPTTTNHVDSASTSAIENCTEATSPTLQDPVASGGITQVGEFAPANLTDEKTKRPSDPIASLSHRSAPIDSLDGLLELAKQPLEALVPQMHNAAAVKNTERRFFSQKLFSAAGTDEQSDFHTQQRKNSNSVATLNSQIVRTDNLAVSASRGPAERAATEPRFFDTPPRRADRPSSSFSTPSQVFYSRPLPCWVGSFSALQAEEWVKRASLCATEYYEWSHYLLPLKYRESE